MKPHGIPRLPALLSAVTVSVSTIKEAHSLSPAGTSAGVSPHLNPNPEGITSYTPEGGTTSASIDLHNTGTSTPSATSGITARSTNRVGGLVVPGCRVGKRTKSRAGVESLITTSGASTPTDDHPNRSIAGSATCFAIDKYNALCVKSVHSTDVIVVLARTTVLTLLRVVVASGPAEGEDGTISPAYVTFHNPHVSSMTPTTAVTASTKAEPGITGAYEINVPKGDTHIIFVCFHVNVVEDEKSNLCGKATDSSTLTASSATRRATGTTHIGGPPSGIDPAIVPL